MVQNTRLYVDDVDIPEHLEERLPSLVLYINSSSSPGVSCSLLASPDFSCRLVSGPWKSVPIDSIDSWSPQLWAAPGYSWSAGAGRRLAGPRPAVNISSHFSARAEWGLASSVTPHTSSVTSPDTPAWSPSVTSSRSPWTTPRLLKGRKPSVGSWCPVSWQCSNTRLPGHSIGDQSLWALLYWVKALIIKIWLIKSNPPSYTEWEADRTNAVTQCRHQNFTENQSEITQTYQAGNYPPRNVIWRDGGWREGEGQLKIIKFPQVLRVRASWHTVRITPLHLIYQVKCLLWSFKKI